MSPRSDNEDGEDDYRDADDEKEKLVSTRLMAEALGLSFSVVLSALCRSFDCLGLDRLGINCLKLGCLGLMQGCCCRGCWPAL